MSILRTTFGLLFLVSAMSSSVTSAMEVCKTPQSDVDGDGYGWEDNRSCKVTDTPVSASSQVDISDTRPSCVRSDSDSDGDGYGWENNKTCLVADSSVAEPAGDVTQTQRDSERTPNGSVTASDITDLILVTGQSNALGAGTNYERSLDAPNDRVFAFTNNGWQIADLNQIWDHGWHPRNNPETDPSNNFSLHFGKSVAARDSSRVVGFILASLPGSKIENWKRGSPFYNSVQNKVLDALNQLPHKSKIDGILWHQGESDADGGQSYSVALNELIFNLRNEQWVQGQAPFICGETKHAAVNIRLNELNADNDPTTACVRASDLSTSDRSHFDARALRTLGARYADAWLDITR